MTATTPKEKKTKPDDAWARDVCRIGQKAACCRFLLCGEHGWSCGKHGEHSELLTKRAEAGTMTARADNCEGRAA